MGIAQMSQIVDSYLLNDKERKCHLDILKTVFSNLYTTETEMPLFYIKFSSLTAMEVVILTIFCASSKWWHFRSGDETVEPV